MKIMIEAFIDKLDKFILSDAMPTAKSMQTKFAIGFARPIVLAMARNKLVALDNLGVFGEQRGVVETDILKQCMSSAFDAGGADGVPQFFGLRLERSDVDKFFSGIDG